MTKSIKFYTSRIAVAKTVSEVTAILASRGAQRVSAIFENGETSGLPFVLDTEYGPREFVLPAKTDGVFAVIEKDPAVPKAQRTQDVAAKIAWRIAKDWLEVQFALVDAGMTNADEVLMPYMISDGKTMYEVFRSTQLEITA